jgi:hypothetical protein
MARAFDPARATRERLLNLERQARGRAEAKAVADGVAETVALDRRRGVVFEKPVQARGGRETPYRRQSGLEWLARKGRITAAQAEAGARYGASFRRANLTGSIGSTLEVQPGAGQPGGPPLAMLLKLAAGRQQAEARLATYRRRLLGQTDLIAACDRVCGDELTPREAAGGEREAARLEAVLKVALDILAGAALER